MNTMFRACVALALFASATSVNAQWYQNPINPPIAPGCTPGTSWTKSGLRYVCLAPIVPANPDPAPIDPVARATALCTARAAQDGITLGPVTRQYSFDSQAGPAFQTYHDTSVGPQWQDPISYQTGNGYMVVCNTVKSTGEFVPPYNNPYFVDWLTTPCVGCGGGS
jgi:hypothetical protein